MHETGVKFQHKKSKNKYNNDKGTIFDEEDDFVARMSFSVAGPVSFRSLSSDSALTIMPLWISMPSLKSFDTWKSVA